MKALRFFFALTILLASLGCGHSVRTPEPPQARTATESSRTCAPTFDDGVSPTYAPNMPVRSAVGQGHVLTGIVLSSTDCQPIPNVKLEFWPEEAGRGHLDSSRATLFSDLHGRYRFECNPPEHIHMRISAEGYRTIGVNSYHPNGAAEGSMDFVLVPE